MSEPESPERPTTEGPTPERPIVLGIESSCDDTACAVLDGRGAILASVVSRQIDAHKPYGGVVPEIASREHLRNWPPVSTEALERAGVGMRDVEVVAATSGPGLVGSLLVGLTLGRAIAYGLGRPFHAIHHIEGHLYSPFLVPGGGPAEEVPERFIGLVVSGGHSSLLRVDGGEVTTIAETRDDAIGEAFDKIGKRVGLAYPQGPRVDRLADAGDPKRYPLPVPHCGGSLDFSYSGLKTQTLVTLEAICREERLELPWAGTDEDPVPRPVVDLLASFRAAAVRQIIRRLDRLLETTGVDLLAVSGGVAANSLLRRELEAWSRRTGVELRLVPMVFAGDNAAMIAHAALLRHRRGLADDPLTVEAASRVPFQARAELARAELASGADGASLTESSG